MRVRVLGVVIVAVSLALAFSRPMDAKSPYAAHQEHVAAVEAAAR
ncbi:MAG: hypothetical protein AB7T31_13980 [Gemmatimonadales bacterium]